MVSKWIKTGKAGWGAITGVKPGTRFKGQSTVKEIKKKSDVKKLHSTMEEFLGKTESDKLRKDISKKKKKNTRVLKWLKDF